MSFLLLLSFMIIAIMTLKYWVEFARDFLSNLNVKKIIGAILVVAALFLFRQGQASASPAVFMTYAIAGFVVGGIGIIIIYFDMARDSVYGKGQFSEVDTLTKAYRNKEITEKKFKSWHMEDDQSTKK